MALMLSPLRGAGFVYLLASYEINWLVDDQNVGSDTASVQKKRILNKIFGKTSRIEAGSGRAPLLCWTTSTVNGSLDGETLLTFASSRFTLKFRVQPARCHRSQLRY